MSYLTSENELGEQLRKLYLEILKREPDEVGFTHYLKLLKNKEQSISNITETLLDSDEYNILKEREIESIQNKSFLDKHLHLTSNLSKKEALELLKELYRELLNREVDSDGEKYWTEKILQEKLSKEHVRELIIQSPEYQRLKLVNQSLTKNVLEDMKIHWDKRAKNDAKFYIYTDYKSENEFWESGKNEVSAMLNFIKNHPNNYLQETYNLKALEIGCGIGRCLYPISENFKEAYGIDVSKEMISIGEENRGSRKNIKFFENNGKDLQMLQDNYFNFCYSFFTFQHIPSKDIIKNYFSEISRVVKSKGLFFFQINEKSLVENESTNTWNGVVLSTKELNQIINQNNFSEIVKRTDEEYNGIMTQYLLQKN